MTTATDSMTDSTTEEAKRNTHFRNWVHEIANQPNAKTLSNLDTLRQLVDWCPRSWNTPTLLAIACRHSRLDLAAFLLDECKANIDAVDNDGWTALMNVAYYPGFDDEDERRHTVEFLLRRGANRLVKSPRHYINIPAGSDALAIALLCGHSEAAELLSVSDPPAAPPAPPLAAIENHSRAAILS